ncbi:MAG: RNA polymerase factor sigma-54 [Pseudomonadota bacterium]
MLKPSISLRIGQQLTMTPQLQQAIRLLQLPVAELQSQLQEALESNLMLEQVEEHATGATSSAENGSDSSAEETPREADTSAASGDEPVVVNEAPDDENWMEPAFTGTPGEGSGQSWQDDGRSMEFADPEGGSLTEHLLWQLNLEDLTPRERKLGEAIVDAIDDDGYIGESLEVIAQAVDRDLPEGEAPIDEKALEVVLHVIQRMDPTGVGARDLAESLTIQLMSIASDTPGRELALRIVEHDLETLGNQQLSALRRKLGTSDEELALAVALIRSLQPRPGAAVQPERSDYVVPDVYVRKLGERWVVEVNPGSLPKVQVNQTYASMLGRGSDHTALKAQLQEARWLVRSLEIRNDTLLRVATCIVERQHKFLEQGDFAMRPMVLRDVAEALDMHESTISRVTTNKYMHTPRGVFEFRHFFSSHVGKEGAEHSSTAIRAMIRKMIANENPEKPLSDNKIAQTLVDDGIDVARRTVAKYREAMSIPSSSERKKLHLRQL